MRRWVRWVPLLLGAGYIGWALHGRLFRAWAAEKKREIKRLREELASLQSHQQSIRTFEKRVDVPVEKPLETIVYRDKPARTKAIHTAIQQRSRDKSSTESG